MKPTLPPPITRRDFLNGVALAGGAGWACPAAAQAQAADPAMRTGLQGQTDAVNATAHAWCDDPARLRNAVAERDPEVEDLVVVGAGLSGLAGAYLFQRHAGRPVRVLLLDALDDIGGHARRNELVSRSGVRLVGYGGSQSLDSPSLFSPAARSLLSELGITLERFESEFFDRGWSQRHGLTQRGLFFGRAAWGDERLVRHAADEAPEQWVPRTPLPPRAQADLLRLLAGRDDVMPGLSRAVKRARLSAMSYRDFLLRRWRVDAALLPWFQAETLGYFGVGIDATSALDAWAGGLPGFDGLALGDAVDARMSPSGRHLMASEDPYIYHFPDGNAGVARALVRALIPAALPLPPQADAMASLADARMDHAQLDRAGQPVRLRLRATAVGLRHLGPPASAEAVEVRYVDAQGTLHAVRARQVLLACWHRVIARLTEELPAAQVQALNDQVKVPLLYATVLLSNWRAWQAAGLHSVTPVAGFWDEASLDFAVNMGAVKAPASADAPVLLHLAKVVVPGDGRPPRVQSAAGRAALQGWSFAFLEDEIRALLQGSLGGFGFDAAHDIEAITVNRWAHGYACEYMRPWDAFWPRGPLPCERARRGWGRVAIANADAGAFAFAHSAIDQATRAVQELLPQARLPAWATKPGPDPKRIGLG